MSGRACISSSDRSVAPPLSVPKHEFPEFQTISGPGRDFYSGLINQPSTGLPDNFGEVVQNVYRSSYPLPSNLGSLAKLNFKSIIMLVEEERSPEYEQFIKDHQIKVHTINVLPNKTPNIFSPQSTIDRILRIVLQSSNHPLLIHCNKGKHRTGCVIACFRKLQRWSFSCAMAEYQRYAAPKVRALDKHYIQNYDETVLAELAFRVRAPFWLPSLLPMRIDLTKADVQENTDYERKTSSAHPEALPDFTVARPQQLGV